MRIDGARVVITGASSGIGKALAAELAERGARLVLAARNLEQLEEVAASIGSDPEQPAAEVVGSDVTDRDSVRRLCVEAVRQLGGIDVWINNAGICVYGETERTTVSDFEAVMAVNFFGPLFSMLEVLPVMRRQGSGVVVNVASIAALHGVPYLGAYGASKAALATLTQTLRAELHDSGVRLINVYPGYTRTPLFQREKKVGGARRPDGQYARSDQVARAIVSAIETKREELVLSPSGRVLSVLRGLLPRLISRSMRRVATQLRMKEQVSHG